MSKIRSTRGEESSGIGSRMSGAAPACLEALENRRLLAMTGSGIDPANMGKGDWIYGVRSACSNVGANSYDELGRTLREAGIKWVAVTAGDGNDGPILDYGDGKSSATVGSWEQFNRELIDSLHANDVKVLGYHYVYGGGDTGGEMQSVPALEKKVAKDILSMGADGLIVDAADAIEDVSGNAAIAEDYARSIKAAFPNAFLAYAPHPYPSEHAKYPYQAYGKWSDAVMPQADWLTLDKAANSPTKMVSDLDSEFRTLYNTFRSGGHADSVKPIVPIGRGCNTNTERTTLRMINQWFGALAAVADPASPGGYNGTAFSRLDAHPAEVWRAIFPAAIGNPGGVVTGSIFNDGNGDGIRAIKETGPLGFTVYADANDNGTLDAGEVRTTTDTRGNFRLFWLPSGGYRIRTLLPSSAWRLTAGGDGAAAAVTENETIEVADFGVTSHPAVKGTIYNDLNANGTRDAGEPGLWRVRVWADLDNDGVLDAGEPTRRTSRSGSYTLTLPLGIHRIRHLPPAGFRGVGPNRGYQKAPLLTRGAITGGKNFGDTTNILIKGRVFIDANRNGALERGEQVISNRTVYADLNRSGAFDAGDIAASFENGVYRFTSLKAGTYVIRVSGVAALARRVTLPSGGAVSNRNFALLSV